MVLGPGVVVKSAFPVSVIPASLVVSQSDLITRYTLVQKSLITPHPTPNLEPYPVVSFFPLSKNIPKPNMGKSNLILLLASWTV